MRKILVFLLCIFWAFQAYPFWIWSPKNQKWKNPEYAPLATPSLQLEKARKKFDGKHFKSALVEFKKILIHFPDSQEAAESQYYIGLCYKQLDNPYRAFQELQKVIDTYPNSTRIQQVIELEYEIGEYFLNREPKRWLGISLSALSEHPSIEVFKKIVENAPYSEYAPRAQYKLGLLYLKLRMYAQAQDAFQALLDNYPESEWAEAAKYQLAMSSAQASSGIEYDDADRSRALENFSEFLSAHPDTELTDEAEIHFKDLREEEAKKNFNIARFYEAKNKVQSAIIYYRFVVDTYPDTEHGRLAREKLEELEQ